MSHNKTDFWRALGYFVVIGSHIRLLMTITIMTTVHRVSLTFSMRFVNMAQAGKKEIFVSERVGTDWGCEQL